MDTLDELILNSPMHCSGLDDVEWEHIDLWMARYWWVDGFQEVTLANTDEHLTRAQLIFPQSTSLAPAGPLKKNLHHLHVNIYTHIFMKVKHSS